MVDVEHSAVLAGRYELRSVVGRGGNAQVWRAYDTRLERAVAVKVLDRAICATASGRARFEREALVAASITHPNVVTIHDFGIDNGSPFLVMQCMGDPTLAHEIASGPLTPQRVVAVMGDVLAGLEAAHERGVLHRDIKPGNVLFADDGRAVLGDFGLATSVEPADLTQSGMVVGTPAYLAPERLAEMPASVRSDLYSVGVMAYEALAGRPPFTGDTPLAIAYAVHHAPIEPLPDVRPDVPPALASVVARAMAREPEARYASASELSEALTRSLVRDPGQEPTVAVPVVRPTPVSTPPSISHTRRFSIPFLVALVAAAFALAVLALRHDPDPAPPAQKNAPTATTLPADLGRSFTDLDEAVEP